MEPLIKFSGYSFAYSGSKKRAIEDVSLEVREGETILVAGPSGCGKSTLLRSIIGLIPHMYPGELSGRVMVDGRDVSSSSISELAQRVGFVFQNPENQIFMFSVERDIAFGLENLAYPRAEIAARVDWVLKVLKIENLATRAPHELSDGQKQRVAIAGVLAMKPRILILDEPTSLLDPRTASELMDLVSQLGRTLGITILIVEHRLHLAASIASRVLVMNEGRIALDGEPRQVFSDPRASLIGVGVPTVTRISNLLVHSGFPLARPAITVNELVEELSPRVHD